jgi:hypothetical protein
MCTPPTFLDLSVHDTNHALRDRFVNEVMTVWRFAHLPVIRFKTDLLKLTWDVEQRRVHFDNL